MAIPTQDKTARRRVFPMRNLRVGARILLALGAMGLAALVFAISNFVAIQYLSQQAIAIFDGPMTSTRYARSAQRHVAEAQAEYHLLEIWDGAADIEALDSALAGLVENLDIVAIRTAAQDSKAILDTLRPAAEDALSVTRAAIEAEEYLPEALAQQLVALETEAAALVEAEADHVQHMRAALVTRKNTILLWTGVFILVGLIGSSFLAWMTAGRIVRRLTRINRSMREVAGGGHGAEVPYTNDSDEIGEVARAVEEFRLALIRQKELEKQASREREAAELARAASEARRDEVEQARCEAEDARNYHAKKSAVADAFFVAFSRIVERAEQGEFDERVGVRFDDPDYDSLSEAANQMAGAIEESIWETSQVVGDLAAGRLVTQMSGDYRGTFATLKRDINATAGKLREVVEQISGVSSSISDGVGKLSASTDQLASRSASQAAALQETNGSVARTTETISNNVARAQKVADGARQATERAKAGQEVVSIAVQAMVEIETHSRQVGQIVNVIDDISFQTNLLALNAGVEAARAGAAGKGFAVVAQEVRQLAQRASEAAHDIGGLISQSTRSVEKGASLVSETGKVLNEIVEAIAAVEANTEVIASSSQVQSDEIRAIAASMTELDTITRGNAEMAEQSATIVTALNRETRRMETLVDFFRDDRGQLKQGRSIARQSRASDWVENLSADRRKEPFVGASIPRPGGSVVAITAQASTGTGR